MTEPFLQPRIGGVNTTASSLVCLPDLDVCSMFVNESLWCSHVRVLSMDATVCGFSPVSSNGIFF